MHWAPRGMHNTSAECYHLFESEIEFKVRDRLLCIFLNRETVCVQAVSLYTVNRDMQVVVVVVAVVVEVEVVVYSSSSSSSVVVVAVVVVVVVRGNLYLELRKRPCRIATLIVNYTK